MCYERVWDKSACWNSPVTGEVRVTQVIFDINVFGSSIAQFVQTVSLPTESRCFREIDSAESTTNFDTIPKVR